MLTLLFALYMHLGMATEDVYTIHFDGVTPTRIPRVDISGPAEELFYRYRAASQQGIKRVNSTHAFVPFYSMLQADYTRSTNVAEKSDTGIAKHTWGDNPTSIIGRNVIIGAAEKMHVQAHEGEWSTEGADLVEKAKATYTDRNHRQAERQMDDRTNAEMWYITRSNIGSSLYKSAEDNHHLNFIEEFALEGNPEETWSKSEQQQERLSEVNPQADKEILRTDSNCWHFEKTEGLAVLDDHSGFYIPLDTHIVSARGQTSFAPDPTFGIVLGVSVFKLDDENDVLEAYMLGSSIMYMPHFIPVGSHGFQPQPVKGTLFVGPADGSDWPMAPGFGREESPEADASLKRLVDEMNEMFYDFDTWERDLEEACSERNYKWLDHSFSILELEFLREPANDWTAGEWLKAGAFVPLTSRTLDCAVEWTRPPPQYRASMGNSLLPLVTLAHGLAEFGPEHRMPTMAGRSWDILESFDVVSDEPKLRRLGGLSCLICTQVVPNCEPGCEDCHVSEQTCFSCPVATCLDDLPFAKAPVFEG